VTQERQEPAPGIIGRAVDEYWQFREKLATQPIEQQLGNPVWHLLRTNGYQGGEGDKLPVTYGLLLNLVGVLGAHATRDQVWSYLANYVEDARPKHIPRSMRW
jgi:lysyl-tRNA synthetase class 1